MASQDIIAKLRSNEMLNDAELKDLLQTLTTELQELKTKDPETYLKVVKEMTAGIQSLNGAFV